MTDRKINFAANLPLKLFRATVSNPDTGSLKSLHTLFDMYLDHMLASFETIVWSKLYKILRVFVKQKPIFDKDLTPFCKTFLLLKQYLLVNK